MAIVDGVITPPKNPQLKLGVIFVIIPRYAVPAFSK
jgi:hypothetical protein